MACTHWSSALPFSEEYTNTLFRTVSFVHFHLIISKHNERTCTRQKKIWIEACVTYSIYSFETDMSELGPRLDNSEEEDGILR